MKISKLGLLAATLSTVCMLATPTAFAAPTDGMTNDVALQSGGTLSGQLIDSQGQGVSGADVSVRIDSVEVAQVRTNEAGQFTVSGLKGGVYEVAGAGHHGIYRLWAPQTAPPSARAGLMMTADEVVVRGQGCGIGCGSGVYPSYPRGGHGGGLLGWMLDHPVVTAGAVAAAIAIPVALSNDDDDPPASP